MRTDDNGLEVLSREECVRLLRSVPVGRVVTSMGALPAALPVNFQVVDDTIVFRSGPGSKLHAATTDAVVGFEADAFDPARRTGWSVMVVGGGRRVTDRHELERLRALDLESWAPGSFPEFVRIDMAQVTGRRIVNGNGSKAEGGGR